MRIYHPDRLHVSNRPATLADENWVFHGWLCPVTAKKESNDVKLQCGKKRDSLQEFYYHQFATSSGLNLFFLMFAYMSNHSLSVGYLFHSVKVFWLLHQHRPSRHHIGVLHCSSSCKPQWLSHWFRDLSWVCSVCMLPSHYLCEQLCGSVTTCGQKHVGYSWL